MTKGGGFDRTLDGLASAVRRFPAHAVQIHALFVQDESFRSICEDLACVDQALSGIDRIDIEIREACYLEFTAMTGDLSAEIERALNRSKIISLMSWTSKRR